ncbi:hypothetical protein HanIR_Chr09g0396421 [Helianthus annuus]|nr:hypothetical protein HanIR_Chr09g0396421 [Helianthus annuus]
MFLFDVVCVFSLISIVFKSTFHCVFILIFSKFYVISIVFYATGFSILNEKYNNRIR